MDTKDGLTAWQALRQLFPEPGPGEPGFFSDLYDHHDLEDVLWPGYAITDFRTLLRGGAWFARGRRVPVDPSAGRERIQPDLWDILDIDPDKNSASGGGLEYAGMRFFEKKKAGKSVRREPVRIADLKRFMEKRITGLIETGEQSSARQDETAARAHFKDRSINRNWITQLRQECNVPEKWSKRGQRNKTGN